jgi:hypothetical protein
MTLPALSNWEATRDALHQVAQIVGAIRVASSDALANDLHYSIAVTQSGVSTTELNIGGEVKFDFAQFTLTYHRSAGDGFTIDATYYNQKSLMQAVLDEFTKLDIHIEPSMKHITHDNPFEIDKSLAQDYVTVMDELYTALARFRAKLGGVMTPIVIWPHHFDMAFIWFATENMDEHKAPHLAIGFAPFSDGIERPYIYGYGWSEETGYVQVELDTPAQAITDSYTGLYADYDTLKKEDNINQIIEDMLLTYQRKASAVLLQG